METKIYADVLLAVNSAMVFAAYGIAAILCGIRAKTVRVMLGSFAIGLISTVLVLYYRRFINPVCIMALAMLGTYFCLGLGVKNIKRNIAVSLLSLLCAALIGGVKAALSRTGLIDNTAAGVLLTAALLYASAFGIKKRLAALTVKKQQLCRLTVCRDGKTAELTALVDTGNELRGSGHESVIIAERQAVNELLIGADTALRLLPFKCIDGSGGVLIGVLCDYVIIDGIKRENIIVAPVDTSLGSGTYNALINPETEVI